MTTFLQYELATSQNWMTYWPAKGYEPPISDLLVLSLQHIQWPKTNFIDFIEILVQKADYRWHSSN